jgi:parvulin-like peptidyl-prolyl isomerase
MKMKLVFLIGIILLVNIGVLCQPNNALSSTIVAIVNDDIITESDVRELLLPILEQNPGIEELKVAQLRQEIIKQLVQEKLMYQEAHRQKIEVQDSEVEERLKILEADAGGREKFNAQLLEQGLTIGRLRRRIREQLIIRAIFEREVRNRVVLSPREIKDFYNQNPNLFQINEEVYLKRITLMKSEKEEAEFEKRIAEVKKALKTKKFEDVAKEYSQDSFAKDGGGMGWIERGRMLPQIEDVVFALDKGQISKPMRIGTQCFIFKVADKRPGHKISFEEAQGRIRTVLGRQRMEKRFREFIKELVDKSYVQVRIEDIEQ